MNLSNLSGAHEGNVVNPWYKVEAPAAQMVHLKFGTTFRMFSVFRRLVGGHWGVALLWWNLLWLTFCLIVTYFFFKLFYGQQNSLLLCFSLSLLLLFNFPLLKQTLLAIAAVLPNTAVPSLELPYFRSFFPQTVLPLILMYLLLQVYAFRSDKFGYWFGMSVVLFSAFKVFPFAVPYMFGVTGLSCVALFLRKRSLHRLLTSAGYFVGVGVLFFAFLHGSMPQNGLGGGEGMGNPISVDVTRVGKIFHIIGPYWIFMVLLTMAVAFMRDKQTPEVKWTVVSAGSTNAILLFGDVFVSPIWFVSAHMEYFMHLSTALIALYAITKAYGNISNFKATNCFVFAATILILAQGFYAANQTYRIYLSYNKAQAALEDFLSRKALNKRDLIICDPFAPAGWLPLLFESQVLYSQQAYYVLTKGQRENTQRYREALYLHLIGMDTGSFAERLSNYHAINEFPYLLASSNKAFLWYDFRESREIVSKIIADLKPFLKRVSERDKEVQVFFTTFQRIFIVESTERPVFQRERLSQYMVIEEAKSLEGFSVRIARPLNM